MASAIIQADKYILLRLPSTNTKLLVLKDHSTVNLGKFGVFHADDIIGKPYGHTYEICADKKLKIVRKHQLTYSVDEVNNNQATIDDTARQTLTMDDIEALKTGDLQGRQIIDTVIQGHMAYDEKTEFSKHKYVKRKEEKFLRTFTPLKPTSWNIAQHFFEKDMAKILELKVETLSFILTAANIRPGGKYLVVDDAAGLITTAILERLGGSGTVLSLHDNEHPNFDIIKYLDFREDTLTRLLYNLDFLEAFYPNERSSLEATGDPATMKSRQREAYYRKQRAYTRLSECRHIYDEQNFDALIIATSFDPICLLSRLTPQVSGSRVIVVYSPHKETLIHTSHWMQAQHTILAPTVSEIRARKFQAILGRIHPEMMATSGGGYVLTGIRVLPVDSVVAKGKVDFKGKALRKSKATKDLNGEKRKIEMNEYVGGEPDSKKLKVDTTADQI
ncbi:tRNA (adenine(58)-N(1))-methyltransferase non-catalytic subunit TRM6 [Neolecta irregularis DAH-3]|uniref:tRNA (adenine(58)-N(1))-methyltransferase non-catalytic subunit TRM6 n=1 Tax=Neolecta irregularis (strain DAH-3) TaxID=1198029 RepID=A0A1U7LTB5_NEOID|nr:tRNA (adenine(58)-N(1))-methyltransferase non-catalytic subunit TRM6 [Neolecta irregularis DAH-3]|eukprot:OLL25858.1 tRNA (adenine(58)-N(1))-methyltransferase non-catalytic subunit TRM6 [Neolecta irregularis DAH-3]